MKLRITGPAFSDLRKITTWIAEENFARAESFAEEILGACERITDFPESSIAIGMAGEFAVRRKPLGNYLIFYRVKNNVVEVLRILHGAQDYSDLF
jgi:toxin ParE1/3/4